MNTIKLNNAIKDSGLSKTEIAKKCGITRATLDNALQGGDIRISIVQSITKTLRISVGYLFDEPMSDNHSANASGHGTTATALDERGNDVILTERVKALEEKIGDLKTIITEKDERIADLKERIDELKTRC